MSQWRITIDRDACVGSGTCVSTAPDHFALDEDDRAGPRRPLVAAPDAVVAAADLCPTAAIRVVDAATGEVVAGYEE